MYLILAVAVITVAAIMTEIYLQHLNRRNFDE
jgi:uncharacterized membrane protein (DUF485 family)